MRFSEFRPDQNDQERHDKLPHHYSLLELAKLVCVEKLQGKEMQFESRRKGTSVHISVTLSGKDLRDSPIDSERQKVTNISNIPSKSPLF